MVPGQLSQSRIVASSGETLRVLKSVHSKSLDAARLLD